MAAQLQFLGVSTGQNAVIVLAPGLASCLGFALRALHLRKVLLFRDPVLLLLLGPVFLSAVVSTMFSGYTEYVNALIGLSVTLALVYFTARNMLESRNG